MTKKSAEKEAARLAGSPTYTSASPCRRGHFERYAANGNCIKCGHERVVAKHAARRSDPDYVSENRRRASEWQANNRERAAARLRKWRSENRERDNEAQRKRRQANPEKVRKSEREKHRKWKLLNPEKARAHSASMNNLRRGIGGRCSADDLVFLLKMQSRKCAECRKHLRSGYHVDHIVPVALGGKTTRANLQLLCAPCNLSKGAAHPVEWARRKGRLL